VLRIAPKLVAPAELAWLTSAPLRLLSGHTPSRQLQQLMGWSLRQVLRPSVAIAQLMELGRMYPAGQVRCLFWQYCISAGSTSTSSGLLVCWRLSNNMQLASRHTSAITYTTTRRGTNALPCVKVLCVTGTGLVASQGIFSQLMLGPIVLFLLPTSGV
jgi:hypothetical protein